MKYSIVLFIVIGIFSCASKYEPIPYDQAIPFHNSKILSPAFNEYVRKNNIKSIDLVYNNETIKDYMVFNDYGQLVSRTGLHNVKTIYNYDGERLIEIINPGKMFCLDLMDKIIFNYTENRVSGAIAVTGKDTVGRIIFSYSRDSITVKTYTNTNPDPIQVDLYQYADKKLLYEKHAKYCNDLFYEINNNYKGDLLISKTYSFGPTQQIDSLNAEGMISSSDNYYINDKHERAVFVYSSNTIEEHRYDKDNKLVGVLKMIINKK